MSDVQALLTEDVLPEQLLEKLSPEVQEIRISETGSVLMKITTKQVKDIKIMGQVDGTIDGSLIAEIWNGEEKIATTYIDLPFEGAEKENEIEHICLNVFREQIPSNGAQSLEIVFAPNYLWAIELMK
jgi:hypothetical protein